MYARSRIARQRSLSSILAALACGVCAWRLQSGSASFLGMLHSRTSRTAPLMCFSGTSPWDVLISESKMLKQDVQALTLELQGLTKDVRSSPLIRQRLLRRKLVQPDGAAAAKDIQPPAKPRADGSAEQQQPSLQPFSPSLEEATVDVVVEPTTSPLRATAAVSSTALDGGAAPLQSGARTPATASSGSKVVVVSAGYDSGDIADFFVDDQLVPIIGSEGRRGINVVVIDPGSQRILSARSYDVWGDTTNQNSRLASDLTQVPPGHIVLVALKDSGMEKITEVALDALAGVGCTLEESLDFREGYALIGVKGGKAMVERWSSKMLLIDVTLDFVIGEPQQSATDMPQPPPAAAPAAQPVPLGTQPAPPVEATMPAWQPPPPQPQSEGPPPIVTPAPAPTAASQPAGGTVQGGQGIDTEGRTWEEVLFLLDQLDQGKPR